MTSLLVTACCTRTTGSSAGMALTQPGAVSDDEHGKLCVATRGLAGAYGRRPGAILQQCLSPVVGDADDNWVSAQQVWNQQAYYGTNIDDGLALPTTVQPPWPTYDGFRQATGTSLDPQTAANLGLVVQDACQQYCGDDVDVLIQVSNDGQLRASADLLLSVYGEQSDGTRDYLEGTALGAVLEPGELTETFIFTIDPADIVTHDKLVVVIDDDDSSSECDESDNEAELDLSAVCS